MASVPTQGVRKLLRAQAHNLRASISLCRKKAKQAQRRAAALREFAVSVGICMLAATGPGQEVLEMHHSRVVSMWKCKREWVHTVVHAFLDASPEDLAERMDPSDPLQRKALQKAQALSLIHI